MYKYVTDKDLKRWDRHNKRFHKLLLWGAKHGLVRTYDDELMNRLREYNYGGLPATILLLHRGMANGHCYDRGTLVSLGFGDDDFNILYGDVDSIKLNPSYLEQFRGEKGREHYADHCVAERIDEYGVHWIYDTSIGLVFEKHLYMVMNNFRIRHKNNKEKTLEFLYEDFIRDSDIERDKYALPLILPNLELGKDTATQPFYQDYLDNEIKLLKEKIDYDGVVREIEEDMRNMFSRKAK